MIELKNVTRYKGILDNCHLEPLRHGFSVFDKQGNFIGAILNEGFAINGEYEYLDKLSSKLIQMGISVFDYETFYEIKNENDIAEILYNEP